MPSLGHDDRVGDQISHLSSVIDVIESRLLHLVKDSTEEAPLEDFTNELALLAKDLRRHYRQIADLKERRDLPFRRVATLNQLDQHCVWLYRKIHLEQTFFTRFHLEHKLRSLLSPEAFGVYQQLQSAEEQEGEFLASDDSKIRGLLLDEPI